MPFWQHFPLGKKYGSYSAKQRCNNVLGWVKRLRDWQVSQPPCLQWKRQLRALMEQGIYIRRSNYTKNQAHGKVWIDGESCDPRDFSGWGHVCKISGHEEQMVELCMCERNSEKLQKWRLKKWRSSWKLRTLGSFDFGNCVEGLVRVRAVLALWAKAQLKNNFVHLFCKQEESPWVVYTCSVIGSPLTLILSPELCAVCRDSSALPHQNSPFFLCPVHNKFHGAETPSVRVCVPMTSNCWPCATSEIYQRFTWLGKSHSLGSVFLIVNFSRHCSCSVHAGVGLHSWKHK